MKSFFKLSIAAVAVAALVLSAGFASAAEVAKNDNGTLRLDGFGAATFGMVQGFEEGGEAPPSTFASATDVRLTATWGSDKVTAQWSKWIRDVDGARGNITQDMAQLTWMPIPELRIDMGNLIGVPWKERAIMWDNYYTVSSVHQNYTYAGVIEDVNGLDVGFNIGSIEVGAGVFSQGLVTGTPNRTGIGLDTDDDGAIDASGGSVANTIVGHIVWKAEGMYLNAAYYTESAESPPGTTGTTWADSAGSVSNQLISVTFRINLGVKIGVTYNMIDGDNYDAVDPWTSISPSVRMPLGEGETEAGVEAELATNGGTDDAGAQADSSYIRVFYQMTITPASAWQVEYEMADNGTSTATEISFNLKQHF
jgi:hypothetical protein